MARTPFHLSSAEAPFFLLSPRIIRNAYARTVQRFAEHRFAVMRGYFSLVRDLGK